MIQTTRIFQSVAIAVVLACSASAQVLPRMKIKLDEAAADLGPVYLNVNTYTIPFAKAVTVLFGGKGSVSLSGDTATVNYEGKPLITMPVGTEGPVDVQIYDMDGNVAQSYSIDEPPRLQKVGGQDRLMIDVDTVSDLLGVANDVEDDTISFFTPAFFCEKLHLSAKKFPDRTAKNLTMVPEIGVTPPANTLLITARGRTNGYVQLYKFEKGEPVPLLGKDQAGKTVVDPNLEAGDLPRTERCAPNALAVAETMHTGQLPKYAFYAAIFTKKPYDGSDPIDGIREGELRDGDWGVAGVRQRITNSPIIFAPYIVKSGNTIESIADEKKLSPGIIRGINGLRTNEQPPVGRKLMLIAEFDQKALARQMNPDYQVTGLHEVQPGDTVESLIAKWKVTKQAFTQANPDVSPGSELEPGELVAAISPINKPQPPNSTVPVEEIINGRGLTKKSVVLHKTSDASSPTVATIDAGTAIVIAGRLPTLKQYRIVFRDQPGYVAEDDIRLPKPLVTATIAFVRGKPYTGNSSKWAAEATKYIGTPYDWGHADLRHGIDCSHFVEAIYKKLGEPVPSPPVHNMEKFGALVGFKAGACEVGGVSKNFATSLPFARLQPGDRIIMQNRADGPHKSDHHTGLYLGEITLPNGRHLVHAMIDACGSTGVTIHDLDTKYQSIYKYALHGSDGRWSFIAPTGEWAEKLNRVGATSVARPAKVGLK